jgi:hypothetical protein
MYRHLRSARQWLARAEESFDQDRDIRGELDLILAQAELQHVREAQRSDNWRSKCRRLLPGAVIVLTMLLATAGGGAYWWTQTHQEVVPIPLRPVNNYTASDGNKASGAAQTLPIEQHKPPTTTVAQQPTSATQPPTPADQPPAANTRGVSRSQPTDKEKDELISPDEMQQLIRAAGKSLRGQ